jgi:hypothetical protein
VVCFECDEEPVRRHEKGRTSGGHARLDNSIGELERILERLDAK